MSGKRDGAAVVGVGAATCVACCAGPILGVLAAIGLTAAAATFAFGALAVVGAAIAVLFVLRRRRARTRTCTPAAQTVEVSIAAPTVRTAG